MKIIILFLLVDVSLMPVVATNVSLMPVVATNISLMPVVATDVVASAAAIVITIIPE